MAESDSSNTLLSGLEGQRVLVTAGAGGIGLAISELLLRQGARVAICDVSDTLLDAFRGRFSKAHVVKADVSNPESVADAFGHIDRDAGQVDVLVNNAGVQRVALAERISPADWQLVLNTHLTGIETIFLPGAAGNSYVSSSLIKEVAGFGGDISTFVPGFVAERLRERLAR